MYLYPSELKLIVIGDLRIELNIDVEQVRSRAVQIALEFYFPIPRVKCPRFLGLKRSNYHLALMKYNVMYSDINQSIELENSIVYTT